MELHIICHDTCLICQELSYWNFSLFYHVIWVVPSHHCGRCLEYSVSMQRTCGLPYFIQLLQHTDYIRDTWPTRHSPYFCIETDCNERTQVNKILSHPPFSQVVRRSPPKVLLGETKMLPIRDSYNKTIVSRPEIVEEDNLLNLN
ncbi:hypothetical protein QCA50_019170 [Cerrena zonata]|uniref:Uncharacterized protein n=1 Tax=Cerrena zonata TaxID=2478898 RepID=A0AAW0F9V8_9APHY